MLLSLLAFAAAAAEPERAHTCTRAVGLAGGVMLGSDDWELISRLPVPLAGSPVFSAACDLPAGAGIWVISGAEIQPVYRHMHGDGSLGPVLLMGHLGGLAALGPRLRIGASFLFNGRALGAGLHLERDLGESDALHTLDLRLNLLWGEAPGLQLMALWSGPGKGFRWAW